MKEPHWAFVDEDGIVHLTYEATSQRGISFVCVACSGRMVFTEAEHAKDLFVVMRTRLCRRNKRITCLACLAGATP